jgi:hypothetical protein
VRLVLVCPPFGFACAMMVAVWLMVSVALLSFADLLDEALVLFEEDCHCESKNKKYGISKETVASEQGKWC